MVKRHGTDPAPAVDPDVTDEAAVRRGFEGNSLAYRGIDIVISNAGISRALDEWDLNLSILGTSYFLVAREGFRAMLRHRSGSAIFIASKNGLVGRSQRVGVILRHRTGDLLARCLAEEVGARGMRVNTVNLDAAVLQRSSIWTSSWREERVLFFASPRSGKSTGNIINVDEVSSRPTRGDRAYLRAT